MKHGGHRGDRLRPNGYQPRLLDAKLHSLVTNHPVVRLVGPRGSGKSWCALAQARSVVSAEDDSIRPLLEISPEQALSGGQPPRAIDEWQLIPELARAAARAQRGPYLMVSSVDRRPVTEREIERTPLVRLWPCTLTESGASNLSVSLMGLFSHDFYPRSSPLSLGDLAELACRGGWARVQGLSPLSAARITRIVMQTSLERELAFRGKRMAMALRVSRALADADWTVTYEALADSARQRGEKPFSRNTARDYLRLLQEIYLVYPIEGWRAPIRSSSRVRIKPRLQFVDPSLPAMLLSHDPDALLDDARELLSLLRCLVLRDLNAYAETFYLDEEPRVLYYADSDGACADAVLILPDGRWGAISVALGEPQFEHAARGLVRLRDKLRRNPRRDCPEPSFLAVALGVSDRPRLDRDTGVYAFPIGCLTA